MLKNKLNILLMLAVMTVCTFAQSIPSGTGRIEALGNSPFFMDAATDINNNPAWNNYYRDYSFGDIGRNTLGGTDGLGSSSDFELSDQYGGITFGVGKSLNLGVIVNRRDDAWDNFGVGSLGISSPQVPVKILIGYSMNKNMHIGIAPYIAMWKHDFEISDTSSADSLRSSRSLGATLGILRMLKNGWFEGSVKFRMNKYEREVTTGSTTVTEDNDGGIELGVNLRAWMRTKGKNNVVPVLGFWTYNFTPKTVATTTTLGNKRSWMMIMGGVGLNMPITDDIQLAGGIVAEYNKYKEEDTDTTGGTGEFTSTDFVLPRFHIGGETSIADWLTARFGFNRAIVMNKEEFTSGTFSFTDSETLGSNTVQTVSVGTGFHFGRLSIDATVSERWLKHGVNFLSGGDNTDMFGVLSASYNFAR